MRLFQEDLISEPFWMIVACVLVNRTRWSQASVPHAELRRRWPGPADLAAADPAAVGEIVSRLGFGRQRSGKLVRLAAEWTVSPPSSRTDVLALHGCGRYAADSWSIFIEGDLKINPIDHYLTDYLERQRAGSADA